MKARIAETIKIFALPENQLMAQYFLNRLYGGPRFWGNCTANRTPVEICT